jgi:hypothetical protein
MLGRGCALGLFRREPAPDLIRDGYRFAEKNMGYSITLKRVPIPQERDAL